MSHDTTWSKDQKVISSSQQKGFITNNYSAKFDVHRSHGSGDIAVFRCHVIPRYQKVIAPGQQKFFIITILLGLVFIGPMEVDI